MTYRGRVENGVVVLEGGERPPEGARVVVEVDEPPVDQGSEDAAGEDREHILHKVLDLATETGIPDLAVNIDHYLYGHPKVKTDDAGE